MRNHLRWLLFGLALAAVSGCSPPTQTKVDQLINAEGRYVSPQSTRSAQIRTVDETHFEVAVYDTPAFQGSSGRMKFKRRETWFVAWGADEKLWIYSNSNGVHHYHFTKDANECCRPGQGGGWDGIPASFLKKLPESEQKVYYQWLAENE